MAIDRQAKVLEAESWGDYHLLRVGSPAVGRDARPGQFVMVKACETTVPLLRRPLSLHDAGPSTVDLFFRTAGEGTRVLSRKRPGETLDLLGPLGKGYTLSGRLKGRKTWLVGGGRGIAPLYFLGRELLALGAKVAVLYGGRSRDDLPLVDEFESAGLAVLPSTDDGSLGFHGLVSELLRRELGRGRADRLYACGPDAMMKAVAGLADAAGIPAEYSLEAMMGCGIGACWGCVHRIRDGSGDGWVKICEEGPVFPGERVVWEGSPR